MGRSWDTQGKRMVLITSNRGLGNGSANLPGREVALRDSSKVKKYRTKKTHKGGGLANLTRTPGRTDQKRNRRKRGGPGKKTRAREGVPVFLHESGTGCGCSYMPERGPWGERISNPEMKGGRKCIKKTNHIRGRKLYKCGEIKSKGHI